MRLSLPPHPQDSVIPRLINQAMPAASRFIRLAGLSSIVSDSQREYLSNRSKAAGIDAKLDLLDGFLWQETPGLQQQAIDLVDQAIGVYNDDQKKAFWRSLNPLFWILRIVEWIAGVPFWLISLLGFSREKAEESKSGQLAKGLIEIGLLVSGFGWVVQLLVNLIQLLHDFGWTKILHRIGFN
jgi:hypothetical protein